MISIGRLQIDTWQLFRNFLLALLFGILISYCLLGAGLHYVLQEIAGSGRGLEPRHLEPSFWAQVLADANRFTNNAATWATGILLACFWRRYLSWKPRQKPGA